MTVVKEFDVSKLYNTGSTLQIVRDPRFGNFHIRWKSGGEIPNMLSSAYTSEGRAASAINLFIHQRNAHFEEVKRAKEAKVKKEPAKEVEAA